MNLLKILLILFFSVSFLQSGPNDGIIQKKVNIYVTRDLFNRKKISSYKGKYIFSYLLYDLKKSLEFNDLLFDLGDHFSDHFLSPDDSFVSDIFPYLNDIGYDGIIKGKDEKRCSRLLKEHDFLPKLIDPLDKKHRSEVRFFDPFYKDNIINIRFFPKISGCTPDELKVMEEILKSTRSNDLIISNNNMKDMEAFLSKRNLLINQPIVVFDSMDCISSYRKKHALFYVFPEVQDEYYQMEIKCLDQSYPILEDVKVHAFIEKKDSLVKEVRSYRMGLIMNEKVNDSSYYVELQKLFDGHIENEMTKFDKRVFFQLKKMDKEDFLKKISIRLLREEKGEMVLFHKSFFNSLFFKLGYHNHLKKPIPVSKLVDGKDVIIKTKIKGKDIKKLKKDESVFLYSLPEGIGKKPSDNEEYTVFFHAPFYRIKKFKQYLSQDKKKEVLTKNVMKILETLNLNEDEDISPYRTVRWKFDPALIQFKAYTLDENVKKYSNFPGSKTKTVNFELENKFYTNIDARFAKFKFYHYLNYEKSDLKNLSQLYKYSFPISNTMLMELTLSDFIRFNGLKKAIFHVAYKTPIEIYKKRADFKSWTEKLGFELNYRKKFYVTPAFTYYQPKENIKKGEFGASLRLKLKDTPIPKANQFLFYFQSDIEKYFTGKRTLKNINELGLKTKLSSFFFIEFNIKNTVFYEKEVDIYARSNYYNIKFIVPFEGKSIF